MNVEFLKGLEENLPSTITDGNIYYCTDTSKLYIDMNGERKCVSFYNSVADSAKSEEWTFTLSDDTTVTKRVMVV